MSNQAWCSRWAGWEKVRCPDCKTIFVVAAGPQLPVTETAIRARPAGMVSPAAGVQGTEPLDVLPVQSRTRPTSGDPQTVTDHARRRGKPASSANSGSLALLVSIMLGLGFAGILVLSVVGYVAYRASVQEKSGPRQPGQSDLYVTQHDPVPPPLFREVDVPPEPVRPGRPVPTLARRSPTSGETRVPLIRSVSVSNTCVWSVAFNKDGSTLLTGEGYFGPPGHVNSGTLPTVNSSKRCCPLSPTSWARLSPPGAVRGLCHRQPGPAYI